MHLNARGVRYGTLFDRIPLAVMSDARFRTFYSQGSRSKRGEGGEGGEEGGGGGGASLGVDRRCRRRRCQTHRAVRRFTPIARHQQSVQRHSANTARPSRRPDLLNRATGAP